MTVRIKDYILDLKKVSFIGPLEERPKTTSFTIIVDGNRHRLEGSQEEMVYLRNNIIAYVPHMPIQ